MESIPRDENSGDPIRLTAAISQDSKTAASSTKSRPVFTAFFLGGAAGVVMPLAAIIWRIVGCHYGLAQINDILSAIGTCGLPPLIVGAGITAGAASIGSSTGRRADLRQGSNQRSRRAAWIGIAIGMFISLIIGSVMALATVFPDC